MRKKLLVVLSILLVILAVTIGTILYIQPGSFFYPWHDKNSYNMLLENEEFKEIRIDNDGKLIDGWFKYNTLDEEAPLLIFFGGNAQNSSNTCMNFLKSDTYKFFSGYNFMVIDYPGYGISEGKTSDTTMFDSALKAYDYASELKSVNKDKIVVLGYSIGTGVATYVASQRDVNGLILVAPYDQALSLYNDAFNIFHGPLKILARYKFDSLEYSKNVKVSPLIITSYDDEVINYELSLNLAQNFESVDDLIVLSESVLHNDYFSKEKVLERIYNYLQKRI